MARPNAQEGKVRLDRYPGLYESGGAIDCNVMHEKGALSASAGAIATKLRVTYYQQENKSTSETSKTPCGL